MCDVCVCVYPDYVVHRWEISCTKLMIPTSRVFFLHPMEPVLILLGRQKGRQCHCVVYPALGYARVGGPGHSQQGRSWHLFLHRLAAMLSSCVFYHPNQYKGISIAFLIVLSLCRGVVLSFPSSWTQVNKSAGDLPTGMIAGLDMASTGRWLCPLVDQHNYGKSPFLMGNPL